MVISANWLWGMGEGGGKGELHKNLGSRCLIEDKSKYSYVP